MPTHRRSRPGRPATWSVLLGALTLLLALAACSTGNAGLAVGEDAPDFSMPTATGDQVSLDDYVGQQPVLLYFHMALG